MNINKIDWNRLSGNKNALEILKKNKQKIDWNYFSRNTSIFYKKPIGYY
jgi:hypothetical protein